MSNTAQDTDAIKPVRRKPIDAEALLASLAPVVAKPEQRPEPKPAPKPEPTPEPVAEAPKPEKKAKPTPPKEPPKPEKKPGNRAQMDVEINPGEGTTAIYVRVPRTTHLALKIQALENQASMEGPTELASIVRTAIGEYLDRQAKKKAA